MDGVLTVNGQDQTITVESLGYAVENHRELGGGAVAYTLTGPRGAIYQLVRTIPNPHHMFAWNVRTRKPTKVQGWEWFTDNGEYGLRPIG